MLRSSLLLGFVFVGCLFPAFEGAPWGLDNNEKNVITCRLCNQFVDAVLDGFANNSTNEDISARIAELCVSANYYNYKSCYGATLLAMPTIRYIYNTPEFIAGNVCGILAQVEDCALSDPAAVEWTIPPSAIPKPPVIPPSVPPQGSPTIKVLHLADIHWDPEYAVGSLANCSDSLCCRAVSGNVTEFDQVAGYWGDYHHCDPPFWTIENAVAHMAMQHPDVGYIIWTGDVVPHNAYETSKEKNMMINNEVLSLMKQYFPNTTLYATLGNHESHPVDTFSPPEITDPEVSTSWLYEEADLQWSRWLPAEVSSTVRYGGYYTTLVHPGLRIVSMNMNYCYSFNYWTFYKSQDPASGLLWLQGVLEQAEQAREKVHIMSHVPPGTSDCWHIWSREFNKIINRFESTVAAQFYGHTHVEEYEIFYDLENPTRPINVAFVAGSISPGKRRNPGYRVYTIDGDRPDSSYAVLDFSTWAMDLEIANFYGQSRDPVWFELYQAKKEYGLTDLSPASMDDLFHRMVANSSTFDLYFKNYHKANMEQLQEGCDVDCREYLLCKIVTTVWDDRSRCPQIAQ